MIAVSALEKQILALSEPLADALGFTVVRVRVMGKTDPVLQIMIETSSGEDTDIDGCTSFSRLFSQTVDLEQAGCGNCRLEISTPGIDRPLTRHGDFGRWTGQHVKIELAVPVNNRRRYKGIIACEDENGVTVTLDDGSQLIANIDQMSKARLVLTDELVALNGHANRADTKIDRTGNYILEDAQTRKVESR